MVKFDLEFDLKLEISDGKKLAKFWGRTFVPAKKARKFRGRISGRIPEKISEKVSETSFQISRLFSETSFSRRAVLIWAGPGVLWKKAPRAMRAMRGNTLETVPFQPYLFQPYFGCTESFLKVLSNQHCQATRAMRAKRVVTVPLQPYFGFH